MLSLIKVMKFRFSARFFSCNVKIRTTVKFYFCNLMGGAPPVAPTGRSDLVSPVPVGGEVLSGYVVELEAGL